MGKMFLALSLGLVLALPFSLTAQEPEIDEETEEFIEETPEEMYNPPPNDDGPAPAFIPKNVRTPPSPKPRKRRFNNRSANRSKRNSSKGGSSYSGSSGNIVFELSDPPKYWEKKKRPPLKPPKGFKQKSARQ